MTKGNSANRDTIGRVRIDETSRERAGGQRHGSDPDRGRVEGPAGERGGGPAGSLPPTSWAVLGLLSFERELSGYDLKKWADHSLRFFYWAPATSHIYRELRRLEGLGFASSREAAQDELRNKRLYRITPEGRDALAAWVERAPVELPMVKHSVVLRVWLGHLADSDRMRSVLEEYREHAARMRDEARASHDAAGGAPLLEYPRAVLRWSERFFDAERELAAALLADLEDVSPRQDPPRS